MKTIYTCYVIITPEEWVYGGITTLKPHKRWNYGNGFTTTPILGDSIRKWGWEEMKPLIIGQFKDRLEAEGRMEGIRRMAEGHWIGKKWDVLPLPSTLTAKELFGFEPSRSIVKTKPLKQCTMENLKKITPLSIRKTAGVKMELTLDTRFIRQTGIYPVVVRLYQGGRYVYLQTGYSSTPSTFPSFLPEEELSLQEIFNKVCIQVTTQARQGWVDINTIGKNPIKSLTLTGIMEEKANLLSNPSTKNVYVGAIKMIKKVYADGLKSDRVSPESINKVVKYMEDDGYSSTTVSFYMSTIKSSINYGIYKGYLKKEQYPFKRCQWEADKVAIPQGKKRDENYLTLEQMHQIWDYFMKTGNVYVGAFLFSYLHGGMNLADMMELKYDDFYFKENGFKYRRSKTKGKVNMEVMVPITKYTRLIMDKLEMKPKAGEKVWKCFNKDSKDFYIRKNRVSSYINKTLQKMCGELDFTHQFSMTTARHTFATLATRLEMPYTMIEAAMGHKLSGVSSHYIGSWRVNEMRDWMEKLL